MESKMLRIKCSCCGAILDVKMQPGLENKNVTCPVCKEKRPFKDYKMFVNKKPENSNNGEHTLYDEQTEIGEGKDFTLGRLRVLNPTAQTFQLKVGRNVVGRKSASSAADFQIPMGEDRRMSREHLVVEVKKVEGKGFVHYVSLYKEKVNETLINGVRLEYGDCVVLKDGDMLRLPEATLVFEIPDGEKTDL